MRVARRTLAFAFVAALTLAACASVAPRLAPPEVRGAGLQVIALAPPEIRFAIVLLLHNPNAQPIALAGLDAKLSIEGDPVADARLAEPATLAPAAETALRLDARADLSAAMGALGRTLGAGRSVLRYQVSGTATLDDGRRIPFSRQGSTGSLDARDPG